MSIGWLHGCLQDTALRHICVDFSDDRDVLFQVHGQNLFHHLPNRLYWLGMQERDCRHCGPALERGDLFASMHCQWLLTMRQQSMARAYGTGVWYGRMARAYGTGVWHGRMACMAWAYGVYDMVYGLQHGLWHVWRPIVCSMRPIPMAWTYVLCHRLGCVAWFRDCLFSVR